MLEFNRERVLANVREAETEDLLDRITVYRDGMEREAIFIIEAELEDRGITRMDIQEHAELRAGEVIQRQDGMPATCSFCERPAIAEGWDWHRMWGLLPVFPRFFHYCEKHRPQPPEAATSSETV